MVNYFSDVQLTSIVAVQGVAMTTMMIVDTTMVTGCLYGICGISGE